MNAKELNLDLDTIAEKFVSLTQDEWFAKDEIEHIRLALTELEEIKKRAEEKITQLNTIKGKTYTVVAMPADEIVNLIDFIIKGEPK